MTRSRTVSRPVRLARSIVLAVLGAASVATIALVPLACQSGGVGDPCTPEDEYSPQFQGFKVTEENIESRSFQCETRICLVNHFQGRVSCPAGQVSPRFCANDGDCDAALEEKCVEVASIVPSCDPDTADKGAGQCNRFGGTCNKAGRFCECTNASDCPEGFECECQTDSCDAKVCKARVCHTPGNCQNPNDDIESNKGKACCVPGTDIPVVAPVCGQCGKDTTRDAEDAVYCSCRCGVAEGEPEDENFNFCECPSGFTCEEIRKNVGLGDKQITGKYCIKEGTRFRDERDCQTLEGIKPDNAQCFGIGTL